VKEAEDNNKVTYTKGKKTAGTGFKKLATIISQKWKAATSDDKRPMELLAEKDLERYKREKDEYRVSKEEKGKKDEAAQVLGMLSGKVAQGGEEGKEGGAESANMDPPPEPASTSRGLMNEIKVRLDG